MLTLNRKKKVKIRKTVLLILVSILLAACKEAGTVSSMETTNASKEETISSQNVIKKPQDIISQEEGVGEPENEEPTKADSLNREAPEEPFFLVDTDTYEDAIWAKIYNEELMKFLEENRGVDGVGVMIRLYADESLFQSEKYDWEIFIGKYDYDIYLEDYCASVEEYVYDANGVGTGYYDGEKYPVQLKDGLLSLTLQYDNIKEIIKTHPFYKIVRFSSEEAYTYMSGVMENANFSDLPTGSIAMPEEFVNSKDGDFFAPKSEYYHVYYQEFPVVYVSRMGWTYDPMAGAFGYGPSDVDATSARITYLESYNEFGEIIQSVGRIEYGKENAALTAFINRFSFYYPDDGGTDINNVPTDFFHENLVYFLDYLYELGDSLVSYDSDVMYFDFMSYYDTHNYGTDLVGNNAYFRYGLVLEPVRSLASLWSDNVGMDLEYLRELDRTGELDDTFKYYFEMDDIISGSTFWSGTYTAKIHGISTASEIMGE